VDDLGEVNMASGETLVDFVTWAMDAYPADKYVLILSDHGMGWPGGWSDAAPGGGGERDNPLSARLDDHIYLAELDQALGAIRSQTGLEQFEMIGMDACLMGHLEVFSALAPHARYAVASQEVEPALGWAYTRFLEALVDNPDMDGAALGQAIVDSYVREDQRIVDDQARAEFLRQGSPMGSLFGMLGGPSAEQVARQLQDNITLTAVDLEALPQVLGAVDALTAALVDVRQSEVARARTYAQSFTSVFGSDVPPAYIDLGNFAQILASEAGEAAVGRAAQAVEQALEAAVVAEKHGPKLPGATGISIYFPNSQLYGSPVTGAQSYTALAARFAAESSWDDFLAYHYTGRAFDPQAGQAVVPGAGAVTRGPGAGQIQVSDLQLSADTAAPGQPVLLRAQISGQNLGYIYIFVGYYDPQANSINVADMDYLETAETRQVDGVYYPVWSESGEFTLEFEWEPLMFDIRSDGARAQALLNPESYGAAPEQAVYSVEGVYTFADGESRRARLYFSDKVLRRAVGFSSEEAAGAPREILPQSGDRFTVLEKWLDLDAEGRVQQAAYQEGDTLVFGEETFTWVELDAAPGDYIVGFIVEDLDGNAFPVYAPVEVR
jgi:hypothetical protein